MLATNTVRPLAPSTPPLPEPSGTHPYKPAAQIFTQGLRSPSVHGGCSLMGTEKAKKTKQSGSSRFTDHINTLILF